MDPGAFWHREGLVSWCVIWLLSSVRCCWICFKKAALNEPLAKVQGITPGPEKRPPALWLVPLPWILTLSPCNLFMPCSNFVMSTPSTLLMLAFRGSSHARSELIYTEWKRSWFFFTKAVRWRRLVVFTIRAVAGGHYAVRCEKRQYLDKPLRLARPSARQYHRSAALWVINGQGHAGNELSVQSEGMLCHQINWRD